MTLATDVGTITDEVAYYICKANHLIIESNYDEEMLEKGRYPYYLKRRITSGTGHLSNRQTAEFLANNFTSKLRNIWLCHLSGDNNNPELAFNTTKEHLLQKGIEIGLDVNLSVLENILSAKTEFLNSLTAIWKYCLFLAAFLFIWTLCYEAHGKRVEVITVIPTGNSSSLGKGVQVIGGQQTRYKNNWKRWKEQQLGK